LLKEESQIKCRQFFQSLIQSLKFINRPKNEEWKINLTRFWERGGRKMKANKIFRGTTLSRTFQNTPQLAAARGNGMKKSFLWGLISHRKVRDLLFLGFCAGLLISAEFNPAFSAQSQQTAVKPETAGSVSAGTFGDFRMEDSVINAAAATGKAVVSITVEHIAKMKGRTGIRSFNFDGSEGLPFSENDPFRKFFDDFFGELPEREYKQVGVGSGVIVDSAGYILTNQHVINEADKVTVVLPDGREFKGEIKGQDGRSDLAIVKITAKDLPVAVLGNSDNLKIGQWVVAIGNPFGLSMQNSEPTVTAGVVSALHRTLGKTLGGGGRDYSDLIQTDAAINPGNSGGPLVNLKGEVVGINVAIFSTSGGYQGIGFAVPSNIAKRIVSRLIEGKEIEYGWLGITVQNLSEDLRGYFGLADKNGVLVTGMFTDGPAQKAGIHKGDILKEFAGQPINNVKDLLAMVNKTEIGGKVKITALREKKEMVFDLEISSRSHETDFELQDLGYERVQSGIWRGMKIADIDSGETGKFSFRKNEGAVVVDVQSGSPADLAGLVSGDLILEINQRKIKNSADFQKITQGLKGDCLVGTLRGYLVIKDSSEKQ